MPSRAELLAEARRLDAARNRPSRAELLAEARKIESGEGQPGVVGQGLETIGKALDYPAGILRSGIGALAESASGRDILDEEKFKKALAFETSFPTTGEMLKRGGVPEGPSLSDVFPARFSKTGAGVFQFQEGGPADITSRGAAGFVGDISVDPLNALAGVGAATKAGLKGAKVSGLLRAGTGLSAASRKLGEKLFESGIQGAVAAGTKVGKKDIAGIFRKHGVFGSPSRMSDKVREAQTKLKTERDKILAKADKLGVRVDPVDPFLPLQDELTRMVEDGLLTFEKSEKIFDDITEAAIGEFAKPKTLSQLTAIKTDIGQKISKNARIQEQSMSTINKLRVAAEAGIRTKVEAVLSAVDGIGVEEAARFKELNAELGTFLSTRNAIDKLQSLKNPLEITNSDIILGLVGLPEAVVANKLLKISKDPGVKTTIGATAASAGGKTDAVSREIFRGIFREDENAENK